MREGITVRNKFALTSAIAAASAAAMLALAVPAGSALAVSAPAPPRVSPACVGATPQVRPNNPGGNGKRYRHLANGVYGYTVYFKHGFTFDWPGGNWEPAGTYTVHDIIYAGSGNLRARHRYWDRQWKTKRHATDFVWHVFLRDWDTSVWGSIPHRLDIKTLRLGAEQVAIEGYVLWGKANGYFVWNKQNASAAKGAERRKIRDAAETFYKNQLENNAEAGDAEGDGDILNEGATLPEGGMAELPGNGSGIHCPRQCTAASEPGR
jgi:hypothetical protein